jgi:hypothetical protein
VKYYVLVAGNGTTSRANLDALMEDHYYANGANGTLVLAYKNKPSQGQVFASQLAGDKSKEIVIFAEESAQFEGLPGGTSFTNSESPIRDAIKHIKGEKAVAFILWDDEDEDCLNTLAICKEMNVPCYDLTDGLNDLKAAKDIKPKEEPIAIPLAEIIGEEEQEVAEDEDEEFDDEDEIIEEVFTGLEALAKLIARAVVAELNASNQPQKGPRKP